MGLDSLEIDLHVIIRGRGDDAHAPAFGKGISQLCRLVDETGSLNKACKEMGMAYSKAWRIMQNAESSLGVTLLERKGAHGSVLTEDAQRLLRVYDQIVASLGETAQTMLTKQLSLKG